MLSLYGALHLVLAVAAARDNKRGEAHQHLETARKIAGQLGEDRDDYGTEFGPTNVAIHAVNIAVELGDAGQAIELGQQVTAASLSPERQARYWLDLAQAHAMRRQIGEALHALEEAERIAPEETRVHYAGRAVARDLLQLSGLRPRPDGDQHGDGLVLAGAAEGDLLPGDHDHAAARYLSWSTSNSASLHPCAVAVAAIDKAFTDQPSAEVRRMRLGLAGSKGPSKTLAGSTGPSLRGSRPRSASVKSSRPYPHTMRVPGSRPRRCSRDMVTSDRLAIRAISSSPDT